MKIASIISYSSYHNAYIERCIKEAKKCSNDVFVIACDHFFDGTPDKELKAELCDDIIHFEKFDKPARYYHNATRKWGYSGLSKQYDAILFIDSDEILEGDKVKLWLETIEPDTDHKLAHLWYYRDTCYASTTPEEGAVLVSTKTLNSPDMEWFGDRERENFSKHYNYMASFEGKALGHHYSWSGTKEMILRKIFSWGHRNDTNWEEIVRQEYTHPFNYTCPFKSYKFIKIEPYIGFTFNE